MSLINEALPKYFEKFHSSDLLVREVAAGYVRYRRNKILGNNFFEEIAEQSEIKSRIVAEYFSVWAKIMSSKARTDRLAYIDLFAGPGRYEDGSKSTPLKVLEFILSQPKLCNMMVTIFNDANPKFVGSLQSEILKIPSIESLKHKPIIHNSQVGNEFAELFGKTNLVPTFGFVDPWGYKGLSSKLITALVKDWGSDAIFFFNYNRINMGITNNKVEDHINSIFGEERADSIRPKLKDLSTDDRELLILNELAQALSDNGIKYVLPFRFVREMGNRTSHYLIFVTKHVLGYSLMKDIMWRHSSSHEDGVASFSYIPVQDSQLTFLSLFNKPLDNLGEDLLKRFSGQILTTQEIYNLHHVNTPFVMKNYREVLRRLEADRKIIPDRPADKRPKHNNVVTFANNVKVQFPKY